MTKLRTPPGPKVLFPIGLLFAFRNNPIPFINRMTAEFGNNVYFKAGNRRIYFLNTPESAQDILVTHQNSFQKGLGLRRTKSLLGEGLLTSEGDLHLRQRRMIQPMFHRQRIAGYADTMVSLGERIASSWQGRATVDMHTEMSHLTMLIVAKTLFDIDIDVQRDSGELSDAVTTLITSFFSTLGPLAELRMQLPLPSSKRLLAARTQMETAIQSMIAERRNGEDHGDLLSMLVAAQDSEDHNRHMSDKQVRDEVLTLFLAGHETTANALAWTFYLLSQNSEAACNLREELDRVLAGRSPTYADLEKLPYTRMVLSESMRLYPPAWILTREALEDVEVGGYLLPKGATALVCQWVIHHDACYYPQPLKFDPQRWTPDLIAARPKMSYLPFGGGARLCIGEPFAWMEGTLLLATLAQRWEMTLETGFPVEPLAQITLRPKYGMKMQLKMRT